MKKTFDNLVGRNKSRFTEASVLSAVMGYDGHQDGNQLKLFQNVPMSFVKKSFKAMNHGHLGEMMRHK